MQLKNLYDLEKSVILTVPSDNHPTSPPPSLPTPLPPTQKLDLGKLLDSTYKCLYQAFLPLY